MGLLTIGAFAKASRLSTEGAASYDELGLLLPARVDPVTGYRLYAPEQLEQARLVAWLRRLGMPLARIRQVCTLEPAPAAADGPRVLGPGRGRHRRTAGSGRLPHRPPLPWKDTAMSRPPPHPSESATPPCPTPASSARATRTPPTPGPALLAVADGFGSRGAPASAAAVDALQAPRDRRHPGRQPAHRPRGRRSNRPGRRCDGVAGTDPAPQRRAPPLTAMLWTGSQLALVAHRRLPRPICCATASCFQITHDHTHGAVDGRRGAPQPGGGRLATRSGRCCCGR